MLLLHDADPMLPTECHKDSTGGHLRIRAAGFKLLRAASMHRTRGKLKILTICLSRYPGLIISYNTERSLQNLEPIVVS